MKVLSCKVSNEIARLFHEEVEKRGESVAYVLKKWVMEYLERINNGHQ